MVLTRARLALACLVLSLAASAATTAQRSPFAQGHWWDPSRAGSGFEFFSAADTAMVIWYTYEESGRPVWYTAQGSLASVGTSWALLRHRWSDGRKAEPTTVGSLRMNVLHPESAEVHWAIGARQGRFDIQPFVVSGVVNEIDHTGSWFDPANSGWGLTLTQQGDVLGGVLFTYDAAGAPTWAAGFGRERDSVELFSFTGSCPSCPYAPSSPISIGRVGLELEHDWQITIRNRLAMPMAQGVRVDGARLFQLSRPASSRAADRQLASFGTDAALRAYLAAGMANLRPYSVGTDFSASPGPPSTPYSPTNLVESGVDEAGLVKTDGRHVYTFAHGVGGARFPVIRIAQVAGEGGVLELRGAVPLADPSAPLASVGLYLHGQSLVSVTGTSPVGPGPLIWYYGGPWLDGSIHVEVFDLANPDRPASRWRAKIDGHLVSSRRIGDRLYLVSRFAPHVQGYDYYAYSVSQRQANLDFLRNTPLDAFLPKVRVNGGEPSPLVVAADFYAPPQGSRPPISDMVTVTAIDLAAPRIAQTLATAGSTDAVYVSSENMYLATLRHDYRLASGIVAPGIRPTLVTDVHQLRLGAQSMSIAGTGAVEGYLASDIDQAAFRMSEHRQRLRVVSTSNTWWANTRNRVTVLEPSAISPGLLRTVSFLPNAKRPESLGKPMEQLYATRFVGDRLYAVTFRQSDPLYVVDLADVGDPKIAGALEVPGFSEYLHPLPNGFLLGFGKDATAQGALEGLQLSLFDVRDAAAPRQVQRWSVGRRGSDSALLRHHHAFSALQRPDGSLEVAIPMRVHDGQAPPQSWAQYPYLHSGLMRFEVQGLATPTPRLVQLPSLITQTAAMSPQSSAFGDPAYDGGRSILFPNGTLFIGNGQFWRLDTTGASFGPF